MFSCKVCIEKEKRISELKEQIAYFKEVLHPKDTAVRYIPSQSIEEDVILSGGGQEEVVLPQDQIESPEVLAEREAMLSGTY